MSVRDGSLGGAAIVVEAAVVVVLEEPGSPRAAGPDGGVMSTFDGGVGGCGFMLILGRQDGSGGVNGKARRRR